MRHPNVSRTERIYRALLATGYFDDTNEVGIIDLLTDLRHLCPEYGLDFDECNRISQTHFDEEKNTDHD